MTTSPKGVLRGGSTTSVDCTLSSTAPRGRSTLAACSGGPNAATSFTCTTKQHEQLVGSWGCKLWHPAVTPPLPHTAVLTPACHYLPGAGRMSQVIGQDALQLTGLQSCQVTQIAPSVGCAQVLGHALCGSHSKQQRSCVRDGSRLPQPEMLIACARLFITSPVLGIGMSMYCQFSGANNW